jgi:hypothetical protein
VFGLLLRDKDGGGGTAFGAHMSVASSAVAGMIMLAKLLWVRGAWRRADAEDDAEEDALPSKPVGALRVEPPSKPDIYLSENGQQVGPFTAEQVKDMIALGSVSQEAWYWREGMVEWLGVWQLLQ